jgi:hypothetical protein
MDVASFMAKHPNGRLATRADNERLLAFYRKMSMVGGAFNIQFVKEPDYFRYLDYEGKKHYVLAVENDAGEMEGMGAVSARPCYIGGRPDEVVHFSDLRFMPAKKRTVPFDWKEFMYDFCQIGHTLKEIEGTVMFTGSFVLANEFARRAFTSLKTPFKISTIASFQMVNLMARRPRKRFGLLRPPSGFRVTVSRGKESDREDLKTFLDAVSRRRELGFVWTGKDSELDRRTETWDGFSIESYFIARDSERQIVGCFAPWDNSIGRRIILDDFPYGLGVVAPFLRRVLRNMPQPGEPLRILYLTGLEVSLDLDEKQRQTVLASMLDALYESGEAEQYHMVSYADYNCESLLPAVKPAYLTIGAPTVLYQMHVPGAARVLRERDLKNHAGHEMCLT